MTLEELSEDISKSSEKDTLQGLEFTINYFNGPETIVGLYEICERFSVEEAAWASIEEFNIFKGLLASKYFFEKQLEKLLDIITDIDSVSSKWEIFTKTSHRNYRNEHQETNRNIFSYNDPSTQFLLKLYAEEAAQGYRTTPPKTEAAFKVFINEDKAILGQVMAYEFMMKDSILTNRIDSEKESLDTLRLDFKTAIAEANSQVIDHLADSDSSVNKFSERVDSLVNEKKELFEEWDNQNKTDYTSWKDKSEAEIETLRQLYAEHIKIEAPAKHWADRATKMNSRGNNARGWLVTFIIITVLILISYFFMSPSDILQKVITGESEAIKWMLSIITVVSFLTYGIRSLNKLMFSSYHLARDAEEREQLTYVYLALIKEGGADREDRSIILQSLFSRVDTGLLKEDSSPTMPSAIFEKIATK